MQVLLLVRVFQQLVHQVVVEVKHVALLTLTLVTHHLYGSVVQEIGDFRKLQEVQKEVNIVTTKCGTLQQVLQCLVCQEDLKTGVREILPTPVHVSTV
jgi:hypothetical protein